MEPLPGAEWARVEPDGRIVLVRSERLGERTVGTLHGSPRASFAFLDERFRKLVALVDDIEGQIERAPNKGRFSERLERLTQRVAKADALGDFDALLARLDRMREQVLAFQARQREAKEELCVRAEALAESTDWRATTEAYRELQRRWKQLGSASPADDEALWKRFRGACDRFFERRDRDRAERRERAAKIVAVKQELCRRAEELAEAGDGPPAASAWEELMEAWKAAGWAGRKAEEPLWTRFRAARAKAFARRREALAARRREWADNRAAKDALCAAAEALAQSEDHEAAKQRARQLQAEWKTIGPVPRAVARAQWERFRTACQRVFDRAREAERAERHARRQRRGAQESRKREQAERLRESIARDRDHLARWRRALGDGDGGLMAALRERVERVERDLAEKERSLERLEREIRAERV